MTASARDLALRAEREARRAGARVPGHRPTGDLPENPVPPRAGTAAIGPARSAPPCPAVAVETCPDCGAPIPESDAWCARCGSSRGISTATPREMYLSAAVGALALLRESHRRVRPLAQTRDAERLLEQAIGRLREGCEL